MRGNYRWLSGETRKRNSGERRPWLRIQGRPRPRHSPHQILLLLLPHLLAQVNLGIPLREERRRGRGAAAARERRKGGKGEK